MLEYYKKLLNYEKIPNFLIKYLKCPSLLRLKNVSYFCGMEYASKHIYDFSEQISRYDHSLTVALITYKLTGNIKDTLAALFHDIATPCFSHVIDYMNKDYELQESTEEYTESIIKSDKYLLECLKQDNINVDDIIDFKKYSIVDNDRPKLCADRLDGIILTGMCWTKNINKSDIKDIITDIDVFKNEDNEDEIGFNSRSIASFVLDISESIDVVCHSYEDYYMMELLSSITRKAIDYKYITSSDLYSLNELELFSLLEEKNNEEILSLLDLFKNIKKEEIKKIKLPHIKKREINPLVKGIRLK